jgi:hypothetical protein
VREIRMLGSVEGARGNRRPYSNITIPDPSDHDGAIRLITITGIRRCPSMAGFGCPPRSFGPCPCDFGGKPGVAFNDRQVVQEILKDADARRTKSESAPAK